MTTVDDVMDKLEKLGSPQTVKTYLRHGAAGPMFGVKVGDLKPIAKRIQGNHTMRCDCSFFRRPAMILKGSQIIAGGKRIATTGIGIART